MKVEITSTITIRGTQYPGLHEALNATPQRDRASRIIDLCLKGLESEYQRKRAAPTQDSPIENRQQETGALDLKGFDISGVVGGVWGQKAG